MGGKAILLVTIGFGFILSYISLNMSGMATRAVGNMSQYTGASESHNLAVTGANVGLSKFYQDTSWYGTITQDFSGGIDGSLGHLSGSFTATMSNLGGGIARLRSVSNYTATTNEVLHDTVEVYFNTLAYNSFTLLAWMTNFEGNVFWITGDTVWGKVHSNGNLHVNGKPVFYEKVTTAKGFDPKPGVGTNKAVFKNGYETGVAEIAFPNNIGALIAATDPLQGGTGIKYPGQVWLTLSPGTSANGDGKVYRRNTKTGPIIDSISLNNPGFNGAILGASRVNIQGTLDGALTVGSLTDVYIQDNAIYANRNTKTSDDILGIVAEKNVVVADNTANRTNCEIDGSIFCRTGSFSAENYNSGSPRGLLKIQGSLVQNTRGAVGTFAGNTLKTGYYKRYHYDDRLADPNFRPPFYPGYYVDTYSIANWWENVRIPNYVE